MSMSTASIIERRFSDLGLVESGRWSVRCVLSTGRIVHPFGSSQVPVTTRDRERQGATGGNDLKEGGNWAILMKERN